ncbi:MAG: hypothetical protein AB7E32_04215 [Desulfovibrio sp.]
MRKIILSAACLAALALSVGCTMEKGGTEDPAGFASVQGLEQPGVAADEQAAAVATLDAAVQSRLEALESENARLQARLDELERQQAERAAAVDERFAALEARPEAGGPEPKPLVDLGDDKAFKEKVVRQGLEEILNMSRLLLDKMEYEMQQKVDAGVAGSEQQPGAAAASGQGAAQ